MPSVIHVINFSRGGKKLKIGINKLDLLVPKF